MIGYLYRLELLVSYKVQPIFHVDRLYRDLGDPLPSQVNKELDVTKVNGELE